MRYNRKKNNNKKQTTQSLGVHSYLKLATDYNWSRTVLRMADCFNMKWIMLCTVMSQNDVLAFKTTNSVAIVNPRRSVTNRYPLSYLSLNFQTVCPLTLFKIDWENSRAYATHHYQNKTYETLILPPVGLSRVVQRLSTAGPLVCCGREECNQCVMLPLVFCRGNLPFSLSGEHALLLRKKVKF